MQDALGTVILVVVAVVGRRRRRGPAPASGRVYDQIGRGGLSLRDGTDRPAADPPSGAWRARERDEEIRQMLEARNARRVRRGQAAARRRGRAGPPDRPGAVAADPALRRRSASSWWPATSAARAGQAAAGRRGRGRAPAEGPRRLVSVPPQRVEVRPNARAAPLRARRPPHPARDVLQPQTRRSSSSSTTRRGRHRDLRGRGRGRRRLGAARRRGAGRRAGARRAHRALRGPPPPAARRAPSPPTRTTRTSRTTSSSPTRTWTSSSARSRRAGSSRSARRSAAPSRIATVRPHGGDDADREAHDHDREADDRADVDDVARSGA